MRKIERRVASVACSLVFLMLATPSQARVTLPALFGSNMVLQQQMENRVWGWADSGKTISVSIAGQTKQATADADGRWMVTLDALPAGGPHRMVVDGDGRHVFDNVLVGEVWVCSGQSNMQWDVRRANDADLEYLTANYPNLRLISVPQVGTQEPQDDFQGEWSICTPQTVRDFSAVGYFFGRRLHQTLDVPVGLIDNAWGGSACEAWINRETLESDSRFRELMDYWKELEAKYESSSDEEKQRQRRQMTGNQRPANIYNGVLKPTIGYGIRGAIWYQGESNASRAYQYRDLFPLMIESWRKEWGQGDFPFYWVQLADFRAEKDQPAESDWAELREAQTLTLQLPNTGQAVIVDLGEAEDIHPKDKQGVANRLARWALAKDYGYDLVYQSPRYASMEKQANAIVVTCEDVGGGLDTFDVRQPRGFTIAGDDKVFHPAQAEILGRGKRTQVKVWSDQVASPVAVRYAWADNPVCNVQNVEGLPLTPFRTDDWPGVTSGKQHR